MLCHMHCQLRVWQPCRKQGPINCLSGRSISPFLTSAGWSTPWCKVVAAVLEPNRRYWLPVAFPWFQQVSCKLQFPCYLPPPLLDHVPCKYPPQLTCCHCLATARYMLFPSNQTLSTMSFHASAATIGSSSGFTLGSLQLQPQARCYPQAKPSIPRSSCATQHSSHVVLSLHTACLCGGDGSRGNRPYKEGEERRRTEETMRLKKQ